MLGVYARHTCQAYVPGINAWHICQAYLPGIYTYMPGIYASKHFGSKVKKTKTQEKTQS